MERKNLLNLAQTVSQDEIYNFFGKIDSSKVLVKRTYPVWTFTNESVGELGKLTNFRNKKIFSILGSADQAIYFLANSAKLVINCDIRDRACLFGEFKKAALESLNFEEFKNIFFEKEQKNSNLYFEKIRLNLSQGARHFFDYSLDGLSRNVRSSFEKSGFFYKESWYFLNKKHWLPYFEKKYFKMAKKRARSLLIFNTSLENAIKYFHQRFDLIYTSNIFDSSKYCPDPEQTFIRIDRALGEKGEILITTQENPQRIIPILEKLGYNLTIRDPKRKFLTLFLKTYAYYYILAKKK